MTWPSDEKLTQGSEARLKKPAEPDGAPSQMENCGCPAASLQVAPPLVETTLIRPLEPPSFHRSCCTLPTRCIGLVGSTAMWGSTSVSGKFVLPRAICCATSAAHVDEPPSGSSGARTTERAVSGPATATVAPDRRARAPIAGGASHRTKGSLKLGLMKPLPPLRPALVNRVAQSHSPH